jgi:nicotinate-nucleotide adenylyltransferase
MGHLIVAEQVRAQLALERVDFVPVGVPWMKRNETILPGQHRLAMVDLAVSGNDPFGVLRLEVDRPGDTFTVDTLEELHEQADDDLFFIMGMDALQGFARWKDPVRILDLATLVVVRRPRVPRVGLDGIEALAPGASDRIVEVGAPLIDISSTDIRQRVAEGRTIRYLVPGPVSDYVESNGLYRSPAGAASVAF